MRPIEFILGPYDGADTDYLSTAQSYATAGALVLTDTLTLAPASFPTITSDGDEGGNIFTFYGKNNSGQDISVGLTGPNSDTAVATLAFASIDSITISNTSAGNVSAGFAQGGATDWIPLDLYNPNQTTTISVTNDGTVNYSVVYTNENPWQSAYNPTEVAHPAAALTGASSSQTASTQVLMRAVRFKMNSGSGSIRCTITQQSTQ